MFENLFERSFDAIWLFDPEAGVVVDCNQAAVQLMGANHKRELLRARPEDLSPPIQADGTLTDEKTRQITALVEKNQGHRFEWLIRRMDGKEVPLEVSATPVRMGRRNLHVLISHDISQRKKAERDLLEMAQTLERRVAERTAALTTSEARFRALVEHAPEAIVVFDGDTGRFLFGNQHACKLYGVAMEQLTELTPADVSPEFQPNGRRSTELAREKLDEALAGGTPIFEWLHQQPCGRLLPTEVRLLRLPAEGQNLIRASIIDNTEHKRAQKALIESEARFSAAFQASPVLIGVMRKSDEEYVLVNDAFVNWMGYSRDEMIGRTSAELGMWDSSADRAVVWKELRGIGSVRQQECRWRNREGRLFTFLLSTETITLDNEPHLLSFALDITQRKQAEVEMIKTLDRERELSQLKSNFVSTVSHEFRTPLGIIQSSSELLRDFHQKMQSAERAEHLESISRNTRRMAGMMEEILVLSRLDAGKLHFQPAPLDLSTFCRRLVDEVLAATNRRCRIELSSAPALPPAIVDERLLGHIFTNLLSNAAKYSEPGASIRFAVQPQATDALFVVQDEGIGISEDDRQKLFTAFHRGANVGSRPGTGLGLVLVKRCVELHNGTLQIESQLTKGTTARVRIPAF